MQNTYLAQAEEMQLAAVYEKLLRFAQRKFDKPNTLALKATRIILIQLKENEQLFTENIESNILSNYEKIVEKSLYLFDYRRNPSIKKEFPNLIEEIKIAISSPTFFEINYKNLLRRYIYHVISTDAEESFEQRDFHLGAYFTKKEIEVLRSIQQTPRCEM